MDISTIIGLVSGIVFVLISIVLGDGRIMLFIDYPSMLIVFGGIISALFVSYPIPKFLEGLKTGKHVFSKQEIDPTEVISKINELALSARKEGLLALEEIAQGMDDPFLQKGILLIVDGTDAELLRSILETEIAFVENRHKDNQKFWDSIAELGPAWGMIGTLIGLIIMLDNLNDPSTLGPKMAVALVTTFYGSMIANLVATPISNKLSLRSNDEILHKQVMVEGLLSIQAGENPRVIEEKLKAFLSPGTRKVFDVKNKDE
ncbi:motility protein A [Cellulosilyticum lentocellum]|uniref:MotA/TolQ/ExbB proton channel n=1 Tax=Cellulosilyticum lentocellum (strain ATCC 49066 / DSM 5427 / NCIMB 11756 / RHM5) TaxID=642492 RepID=F2JGR4_CELLD|nr:MotA/TolQ/ExbB proton channel family protein [Cellulosilyticum lentocellum]ADZ84156.1 MotA/TolQ/ExbB proton channel [Cellulosilyticum lentocellum DSM 5427]